LTGVQRPGEQPALAVIDPFTVEQHRLVFAFDAFGNHPQVQVVGHADDVRGHTAAGGVVPQGVNEGLVDLQAVHGQRLQVGEAAVTRAKIVDQHLVAHRTQGLQVVARYHHVDQAAFGHLEGDLAGRHPVQGQQPRRHPANARDHHITRRKVYRDVQVAVRPQQLAQLLKHPLQDKVSDLADLPGIFGQRNEQVRAGQSAVRAAPAHQGLGTDTTPCVELDDRLVKHLQFAPAQCVLQLRAHRAALQNQLQHQPANAAGGQHAAREQQPEHAVHAQGQAGAWRNQHQLVIRRFGRHAVDEAVAQFEQRLVAGRPG